VEKHYGGVVRNEIINEVVGSSYGRALEEKKLHPIRQPQVEKVDYSEEKGLSYQVELEHFPEFELPEYTGVKVEKKPVNITESDVLKELTYLQDRRAQFEPIEDRPLAMGDFAIIDYQIMLKKDVLDEAKEVWLEMKEDFMIPKFCQGLVGLKKGQEKDVKTVLPKNYPKEELRDKKVIMHVKVNELKKKVLPEVDDNFAKEIGGFNNLGELQDKIKEELTAYGQQMVRKDTVRQLEDYLLSKVEFNVPESVADNYAQALYGDTIASLKNSGVDTEKYIKEKDAELKQSTRKEATDQVKLAYVMEAIAAKENIDVPEAELEAKLAEVAERNKKSVKEIKEYLDKEKQMTSFVYNLRKDKIITFLLEKAEVKELSAAEAEKAKK